MKTIMCCLCLLTFGCGDDKVSKMRDASISDVGLDNFSKLDYSRLDISRLDSRTKVDTVFLVDFASIDILSEVDASTPEEPPHGPRGVCGNCHK